MTEAKCRNNLRFRIGEISVFAAFLLGAALGTPAGPWAIPPEGACAPGGGLRGPIGSDAPPIPFAPGQLLEVGRLDVLSSYLPAEVWEHRERFFFEGMQLEVGPCFRNYAPPAFFDAATEKFRGQARLTEDGGLVGHTAGLPFHPDDIAPDDPQAGTKWAWNAQSRYRAGGFRGKFRITDLIGRVGYAEPFAGEVFQHQLGHRADRPEDGYRVPNTGTRLWVAGGRYDKPFDARELAWLQLRDADAEHDVDLADDLHMYLPELRKVRRVPSHGIEGVHVPTFGVTVTFDSLIDADAIAMAIATPSVPDEILPKRSGFEGLEFRPLQFEYKLLGVQDVLAPINAKNPAYPASPLRSFGPYGLSWASDRWDLRRAIVLEATRRGSSEEGTAQTRTWYDLQTLYPLYYVSYDKKGEQIDVGVFAGRWSGDREDYPSWPGRPGEKARVIDPVGATFANLRLVGSWRRESWDIVSTPVSDKVVRDSLSVRHIQRGR